MGVFICAVGKGSRSNTLLIFQFMIHKNQLILQVTDTINICDDEPLDRIDYHPSDGLIII